MSQNFLPVSTGSSFSSEVSPDNALNSNGNASVTTEALQAPLQFHIDLNPGLSATIANVQYGDVQFTIEHFTYPSAVVIYIDNIAYLNTFDFHVGGIHVTSAGGVFEGDHGYHDVAITLSAPHQMSVTLPETEDGAVQVIGNDVHIFCNCL